ncbi:MAG: stage III sporulation protein AF [Oscillospiraceae bacterium]|nr:stage III sporulation protein AF [Oscillospiraceae bacterium]
MREILLNISLVAVATALFRLLVPENNFKKQISFLISCFFITAVISFITGGGFGNLDAAGLANNFDNLKFNDAEQFVDFTEQTVSQRKRAIAEELSGRVRELLAENDIYPSKIYVIVNISGLYSISINEIKLVLPPDGDFTRASALVEKEVGTGVKVTIEIEDEVAVR